MIKNYFLFVFRNYLKVYLMLNLLLGLHISSSKADGSVVMAAISRVQVSVHRNQGEKSFYVCSDQKYPGATVCLIVDLISHSFFSHELANVGNAMAFVSSTIETKW